MNTGYRYLFNNLFLFPLIIISESCPAEPPHTCFAGPARRRSSKAAVKILFSYFLQGFLYGSRRIIQICIGMAVRYIAVMIRLQEYLAAYKLRVEIHMGFLVNAVLVLVKGYVRHPWLAGECAAYPAVLNDFAHLVAEHLSLAGYLVKNMIPFQYFQCPSRAPGSLK